MKKNKYKQKNARGSALLYGLVIMFAVSVIISSLVGFIVSQTRYGLYATSKESALQISESGVNFYRWYLAHMTEGKTAKQIQDFWETGNPYGVATPYEADYFDPGGTAIGKYSLSVAKPDAGSTIVTVVSTGWTYKHSDAKRIVRVRLRRPSWSEYTVLANADVWFGTTETVLGKVFSNGGIRMDGYATNTVSSAVSTYKNESAGAPSPHPGVWSSQAGEISSVYNVPVFQGGKQFPMPAKDFNSIGSDLNLMKSDAIAGVNGSRYFDTTGKGRHIKLNNGTFQICTVTAFSTKKGYGTDGSVSQVPNKITGESCNGVNLPLPTEGVIFVENNVWLEGKINTKRVTIAAANLLGGAYANMYIGTNNIQYTNYDGRDSLGIIAQGNIEAIYDSVDVFRIDGALLAQTGRIERSCYACQSFSDSKTSIHTFGALATYQQYTWNWCVGGCGPLYGFANTQSEYDNNLYYAPPPYFPTGTQYLMDLWEEL